MRSYQKRVIFVLIMYCTTSQLFTIKINKVFLMRLLKRHDSSPGIFFGSGLKKSHSALKTTTTPRRAGGGGGGVPPIDIHDLGY